MNVTLESYFLSLILTKKSKVNLYSVLIIKKNTCMDVDMEEQGMVDGDLQM